jgi:signal transduction histidine kinase
MGRGPAHAALAILFLAGAAPIAAAQAGEDGAQQVLVLQSLHRGNLTLDRINSNFRVEVEQRAGSPLSIEQVAVGRSGLAGPSEHRILDYVRSIYSDHPPDLIVAIAGPAATFARKYRQQLFPDVPLIFAATDLRFLGEAPLRQNETAVSAINDFPRLIDDLLQVLPETRHVFMVTGAGAIGQFWRQQLASEFKRFEGRLTFNASTDLTLPEILRRCASLPSHSAIFYLTMGSDAQGTPYPDERVLASLHATANAPMFAGQSSLLGFGIVGGSMIPVDDLSRNAADVAIRILNGESPSRVHVPPQRPGAPVFDWRELQRWGIPESRLPAGSIVQFRSPTLWSENRGTVVAAIVVLLVQSALIVGLLSQRRARRRAELESRKNLSLAADANRRQTMSVLSNSIAHELGQPLGSMLHNAQALQRLIIAERATTDTIVEILSDVHTQGMHATQIIDRHRAMLRSHQLDRKPIDLCSVIAESLALLSHDLRTRQIESAVKLPPQPCVINGDQVLLQQMLVNLIVNAMDAIAGVPGGRRRLTVTIEVRFPDVMIAVRDTGPGLPEQIDGQLFAPFVTTKSHGLGIGLTIVRTIVEAHGGSIVADNNPDGGATFAVTLPLDAVSMVRVEEPGAA